MTSNLFSKPNYEEDEKELAKETKQQFKLSEKMWKPTKDIENHIRILPARGDSNASYHMKIGKHFIEHDDRTESFICMRETYGKDCPACEAYYKIRESIGREKAYPYWPKLYGVFNIIDRLEENPKVKLYEAPRTLVWKKIIFINKGSIKIVDEFDENGECVQEGRDLIILFYPKAEVHNKYVVYPGDQSPLGTAEEIENWHKDIVDLIPEQIALYGPIEYEVAKIKAFGTEDERDEMRAELKKKYEAMQDKKKDESEEEKEKITPPVEEESDTEEPETDKVAQLEKELANAKAEKTKEALKPAVAEAAKELVEEGKEDEVLDEVAKAKKVLAEAEKKAKATKKKSEKIKEEPKPKPAEKDKKKDAQSEAELDEKIADIREQIKAKKKK